MVAEFHHEQKLFQSSLILLQLKNKWNMFSTYFSQKVQLSFSIKPIFKKKAVYSQELV